MKAASSRLKKAMMSVDSVVQLQRFAACAQRPIDSANYRETSSLLTEPKVFGRDKEKETMIENMLAPHGKDQKYGNFSVLPIVGIGGVGKTTLAQSLYNDPRIMRSFMVRAWACASDALNTLDVRKLTIDITLSIDKEGSFNLSMMNDLDKIQQRLIKEISGKKFLIVIDDVWVTSRWEVLIAPLSYGMAGSIVIVTTREQNIGKRLGSMPTVTLTGLEKDLFWDFFVQNAFMGKSPEDHPTLVSIGQDIIAKLHGIPLAAKTVGRLLNKKLDEAHWFSILNSELWELRQAPDDIIPVLKLSYQFFSVHVQRCFSYCSVFPKDHLFTEEELLSTWIAQGFTDIQPGDKSPEHVAQDYLNELLSSSFFQPKDGYYLMHDLLHDLAISVSQDECHVMKNDILLIPSSVRHLCVPYSIETKKKCCYYSLIQIGPQKSECPSDHTLPNNQLQVDKLRTLIFTDFSLFVWGANAIEMALKCSCFTNTRVLVSRYSTEGHQLGAMHSLIHLRYLDLSFSSFGNLPESVCVLYHLQNLNIKGCGNLLHLPKGIVNLIKLRHLIADGRHYLGRIPGIGKMTCLQELDAFYIEKELGHKIIELKELQELRGSLRVHNLDNVENGEEASQAKLKEKRYLTELRFSWDNPSFPSPPDVSADVLESVCPPPFLKRLDIIGYNGTRCPTWFSDNLSLSCLKYLYLRDWLGWESLPPLGHLPHLTRLELINISSVRKAGSDFYGLTQEISFPRLKELLFRSMPNWREWDGTMQRQLFPCLENLTIRDCPSLKFIPVFQLFRLPNRSDKLQHFPTRPHLPFNLHPQELASIPPLRALANLKKLIVMTSPGFAPAWNKLLEDNQKRQSGFTSLLQELHISSTTFLTLPICRNLASLTHLTFSDMEGGAHEVTAFTNNQERALELLTSLQTLVFKNCRNLQILPEMLYRMLKLKELHVVQCNMIESLPDNGLPASLEVLVIDRNSRLDTRCQGAEQHKIAHVREVKYFS
ncbi:Symbiosis-related disease resistance protein [Rhynchospora pubera]|uniref:Symbiosis-related disease resistance protein n=1 Tax=Rhynchospora pubera TaxID=906938 RepID=A0AAV8GZ07_9POAL|nr:Symbiosis-related disease resistance protein [Rhynchospora pubera]